MAYVSRITNNFDDLRWIVIFSEALDTPTLWIPFDESTLETDQAYAEKVARLLNTEAPALLAALTPFTRLWQPGMEAEPDDKTVWITDSGPITVGDIRRAREVVAQAGGGE